MVGRITAMWLSFLLARRYISIMAREVSPGQKLLRLLYKYRHYLASFVIQIVLAGFFAHPWDVFVFTTSAGQFLQGITPYETALLAPPYTFSSPGGMQEWYAYPPLPLLMFSLTYMPYFFFIGDNPILSRIFLKISFILGNLLCAYLVRRFVAGSSSEENAARAEKMVLYNPFLILIASIWGMFDIWMVNFLLLCLLNIRKNNFAMAGIFYGLSLLVKPIPIIFAPALFIHALNQTGSKARPLISAGAAVLVFTLVSLPFFVTCPEGFINQVVGMHMDRPGGGWSLLGGFGAVGLVSGVALSVVSMILIALPIGVDAFQKRLVRDNRESDLLASLFFIFLAFILFNKLVNPQYLVIAVVLAVVLFGVDKHYDFIKESSVARYYNLSSIPYTAAALLLAYHFIRFVPSDISLALVGETMLIPDAYLAPFDIILTVISAALVLPASLTALSIVYSALKQKILVCRDIVVHTTVDIDAAKHDATV